MENQVVVSSELGDTIIIVFESAEDKEQWLALLDEEDESTPTS